MLASSLLLLVRDDILLLHSLELLSLYLELVCNIPTERIFSECPILS